MSKQRPRVVRLETREDGDREFVIVPTVDMPAEPTIRIYDPANDGSYWFRKIGFNRSIADES